MAIRIATIEDLDQILSIYRPYVENTTVSFEYEAPTMDEFRARFEEITAQFPWLVWEDSGMIAGYTYACAPFSRAAYRWCAEPSIYLHPDFHGKGLAESCTRHWRLSCVCRATGSAMPLSPRKTPALWLFMNPWDTPVWLFFPTARTSSAEVWASFGWKSACFLPKCPVILR